MKVGGDHKRDVGADSTLDIGEGTDIPVYDIEWALPADILANVVVGDRADSTESVSYIDRAARQQTGDLNVMLDTANWDEIERATSAIETALGAGQIILKVYEGEFDVEIKPDETPITVADLKAHEYIDEKLNLTLYISIK